VRYIGIRKWVLKIFYSWLMRILLMLPFKVMGLLKLTTNLTYFAQKAPTDDLD